MLRFRMVNALLAVPAVAALLFVAGCGGGKENPPPAGDGGKKDGSANVGGGAPKTLTELQSKGTATIEGKVSFEGTAPEAKAITFVKDEAHCKMGPKTDTTEPLWRVGPDVGIGNVIVWVQAPKGSFFKLTDAEKKRDEPVVIHQPYCAFEPHVFVVYPSYYDGTSKTQKKTGQILKVINDATIPHNSNVTFSDERVNREGANKILEPKKGDKIDEMTFPGIAPSMANQAGGVQTATVKCNVHTWMNAYGKVLDHPFYAVTKGGEPEAKEYGTYKIENVPAGVELELVYWARIDGREGGTEGFEKDQAGRQERCQGRLQDQQVSDSFDQNKNGPRRTSAGRFLFPGCEFINRSATTRPPSRRRFPSQTPYRLFFRVASGSPVRRPGTAGVPSSASI
jgi:hypothetical protein